MRKLPRLGALVLLALGVIASIGIAIWIVTARRTLPSTEAVAAMSPLRRGIEVIVHSRLGMPAVAALGAGAVAGGVLFALALKRRRWALAVIAAAAFGAIVVAWGGRHVVKRMEDPRYVNESRYVTAATGVAIGGTVYFAALGGCALAAFLLARERKPPPPPATPAPSPG